MVVILDCVMTFFGSTANDGAFNAYVTDVTNEKNRGRVESVLAILPLISMLVIFGLFDGLTQQGRWKEFFGIFGAAVSLVGLVSVFLVKDEKKKEVSVRDQPVPGGKTAITTYETLDRRGELSLVEVGLETGRTHQIRATFAHMGCPLLGDGKYGRGDVNRRYGETRQALYSYKLTFDFPTDAGLLNYLKGRTFQVEHIPFREKYFG